MMCSIFQLIAITNIIYLQNVDSFLTTLNKCPSSSILQDEIILPDSLMTNKVQTLFRLQSNEWSCTHGSQELTLTAQPINSTTANGTIMEIFTFTDFHHIISPSGLLEAQLGTYQEYFNPNDYCIESIDESEIIFRVCKIICGNKITCVPKCCAWDNALTSELSCLHVNQNEWSPIIYFNETHKDCTSTSKSLGTCIDKNWKNKHLHYIYPELGCDPHDHSSNEIPFQLLVNGSILFSNSIVISSNFCVDGLLDDNGVLYAHMLLACREEETKSEKEEKILGKNISITYSTMMFISSFFLFMTALVYILIWDKHNLHGYTVFSHSVSMFFMFIFLAISHILSGYIYLDTPKSSTCVVVGLLSHYFFLSTFCWLTMLNFDLWWTFKTLSPTIAKSKGLQRFMFYSLFAWGVPTCFVLFAFILDQKNTKSLTWIPLAQYGTTSCYIQSKAQGIYLYIPIGILLGINLIFFGTTVYIMYKYQKSTRSAREGKANGQSQSFQLFAKLFLVMGVTWIFEVISWSFSSEGKVSVGWLIFDFLNILQGIAIFIIFVCKRQVLSHLWNKYPSLRWCLSPLTRFSGCKPTGMDIEGPEVSGGRTTQSNISMKTYSRASSLSES